LLIPGTSSVKHLEENMKAENIVLTEEQLAQLEA
jgi:aryl-alcohol dehydrogenase-like predicted oxidoreductase